ncbi:DUF1810 domain-containing protein [Roseovarius salinarum]|uniref:DUF1810 domain-containing protein n=1 Tax=Roseovarius salinarum TaxID=1981892 RepID=UPI000C341B5A|nr:DUF1810 domain-containing protein [Roseovarius salinarum]
MSLDRFKQAQDGVWPRPLEEIRAGRKTSHWMWYVFPQLRGLGRSATAQHYGLKDIEEARAYLDHPVLGPRLTEISRAMLAHAGTPPEDILGPVDSLKLRSCATLFLEAGGPREVFGALIDAFYQGTPCPETRQMLGADTDHHRK